MTVGVIDIGTNSVRVLITDGSGLGERDMRITRLGQDVDRTRTLADDAMARTLDAVRTFTDRCRDRSVDALRVIATSAVRDAGNRTVFLDRVREVTAVDPDLLSGEREAALAFRGATRDLDADPPILVCDIGGGSTEVILGAERVASATSFDIGSVRLTERHIHTDPPAEEELDAVRADASAALAGVVAPGSARTFVGVAGTITTVAALALGLEAYDPAVVHRSELTREDVGRVVARLGSMTTAQRAALPVMPPGREDVIVAGALIFEQVLDASGMMRCTVSESDILDGAALDLLAEQGHRAGEA